MSDQNLSNYGDADIYVSFGDSNAESTALEHVRKHLYVPIRWKMLDVYPYTDDPGEALPRRLPTHSTVIESDRFELACESVGDERRALVEAQWCLTIVACTMDPAVIPPTESTILILSASTSPDGTRMVIHTILRELEKYASLAPDGGGCTELNHTYVVTRPSTRYAFLAAAMPNCRLSFGQENQEEEPLEVAAYAAFRLDLLCHEVRSIEEDIMASTIEETITASTGNPSQAPSIPEENPPSMPEENPPSMPEENPPSMPGENPPSMPAAGKSDPRVDMSMQSCRVL